MLRIETDELDYVIVNSLLIIINNYIHKINGLG